MNKKGVPIQRFLHIAMALIGFGILFCSYWKNAFNIVDMNWFQTWQNDSEWLVWLRLYDNLEFGFWHNSGLLGEFTGTLGNYNPSHPAYTAQMGLQGMFYGLLYIMFPEMTPEVFYAIASLGVVLCLFVFLYWIYNEFGISASICSYIIVLFNQWITVAAKNLYWALPTFFLPFLVMLILFHWEEQGKTVTPAQLFIAACMTIFIRSACGYEFISTVMISLELPLFYYAYKNKWSKKTFFYRFILIALAALVGFLIAIGICMIQVYVYANHNIYAALDEIWRRIGSRTGAFSEAITYTGVIRESLIASKWSVIMTYYNQGLPLIANLNMNQIMPVIITGTSLIYISDKISPTMKLYRTQLCALGSMTWVSLLGPLSWIILATGHAYIHTHICYLLWSIPFLILGLTLIGIVACILINDILRYLGKKKIALCSILLFGITFTLFYNHYSYGSRVYSIISKEGKLLYSNENTEIWFENNSLFYVIDADMASKRVFLHYYPKEGNGHFINSDFELQEKEIRTLPWSPVRMAKIEFPQDCFIDNIETGQFNEELRFWETEISTDFLVLNRSYDIFTLSDNNWTYGVNNLQNCFLIASNDLALYQLEGRNISISDLMECQVVDVVKQGDYFWIYVDKDIKNSIDISLIDQITVQ